MKRQKFIIKIYNKLIFKNLDRATEGESIEEKKLYFSS